MLARRFLHHLRALADPVRLVARDPLLHAEDLPRYER